MTKNKHYALFGIFIWHNLHFLILHLLHFNHHKNVDGSIIGSRSILLGAGPLFKIRAGALTAGVGGALFRVGVGMLLTAGVGTLLRAGAGAGAFLTAKTLL